MQGILIGIAVAASLAGALFYNPIRRKMAGKIGVGGSYLVLLGIMLLVMSVARLFGGGEIGASATEIIVTIVFMLIGIGYMVYVMLTRCCTAMERILLPFAAVMIGLGFCWRFLAALVLHIPMESGNTTAKTVFPSYILAPDGEKFQLENDSGDNATYYCNKTGQRVHFRDADFDEGYPTGWYPA